MPARRKQRRSVLGVFTLLLAVLELPVGLSLCIAEDGHSTIELAHAGAPCTSHFQHHHPDASAVEPNHLDEHPCRDVPFLAASARRDTPTSLFTAADARAVTDIARTVAPQPSGRSWVPARSSASPALASARSVVLLT